MAHQKINLMIIGAQKSGTTSLLNLLGRYPKVCIHKHGEFPFFVNNEYYNSGIDKYWKEYFNNCTSKCTIIGKSAGLMNSKKALVRLKEHNTKVKLVIILRNPVDRAYSAYWYARRKGWETIDSFEDALKAGTERFGNNWIPKIFCNYLERGEYAKHLKNVLSIFPKENVFIYKFEDFKNDEIAVCDEICKNVGIDNQFELNLERKKYNAAAMPRFLTVTKVLKKLTLPKPIQGMLPMSFFRMLKKRLIMLNETKIKVPEMDKEIREQLIKYYHQKNNELAKIVDWNVKDWSQ